MYFGGDVYSSADPFATALGHTDGKVSFIGSDEAAKALDPEAIDLAEDFLTPGIVHAGLVLDGDSPTARELHDQGYTHVHALGTAEAIARFAADAPEGLSIVDYPGLGDGDQQRASAAAAEFLSLETLPETQLFVLVDSNERLGEVLESLRTDAAHAQRHGYRLLLDFSVDDGHVEALGRSGVAITLDPALPQPLSHLLAAGAQVSFCHSQSSPWATVRSAVVGENGIGARAAFNAATRFAHRAASNPEGGVLVPGAAADIVRWKVERLVVQVADPRVAAWSTDPRSGTPGLPELAPDVPLPTRIAL
ncbi:amidohydrolase family protein [Brevibacterium atlanticum]|uniref:metal-dependent hydrolase n=1 Tax=Brevibacterium atlanticum TaxID=2697563 RepID=UPI001422BAAF|nr:metal-dependent hydrolase [Brevibacterium atlanticum]